VQSLLHLGQAGASKLELPSGQLTTHAFVVGMTGSGKTGLCAVLVEEVLRAGVPVIAVDPKGDLGNLLLPLDPDAPADWEPWAGPGQAAELAARAAAGLKESGLSAADVRAYARGHAARLYTPGSTAGVPVNAVGSLQRPSGATSAEAAAESVDASVRAVLGLLRIDADPVRSREYILLHQLVSLAWEKGESPSLGDLVRLAADPPFDTVGALPLETFYPRKERAELALALNGLVASPRFAAWRSGAPLDVASMLRDEQGRPRLSVFSTAHLPDEERLFATALLLDRVKAWVRGQPGTGELRALLFVDEIFGYFPPHPHNPPTKEPLLTLLKQARAFGLGVVLATQNPVDLDYKGLANIGTWFVGRLQTDEDKERIRDGLQGAAAAAGQRLSDVDRLLSGVDRRVFLLHSIHRGAPELFRTRQSFSFLRGPLSREEIARLTAADRTAPSTVPARAPAARPVVPVDASLGPLYGPGAALQPHLLVKFAVRHRLGRRASEEVTRTWAFPLAGAEAMGEALEAGPRAVDAPLTEEPPPGATLGPGPEWLPAARAPALTKVINERLPSRLEAMALVDEASGLISAPGEGPEAFAARVAAAGGGKAAQALEKKLDRKRLELQHAAGQLEARRTEKWAQVGGAAMDALGLFLGTKRSLRGVGGALSKQRMEEQAQSKVELLQQEVASLEAALREATAVNPERFHRERVVPGPRDWSLLRVAVAYLE
jgi:uncharacterized protein DUF87